MTSEDPDFTAYAVGLLHASVCTSLNDVDAALRLNEDHPLTDGGWRIADEPFATGEPNGRPCERHPSTHRHILFTC